MPGRIPWLRFAIYGLAFVLVLLALAAFAQWFMGPRLRAAENKALQASTDETVAVQQGELQQDVVASTREYTQLQPIIVERSERAAAKIQTAQGADSVISPDVYADLVGVLGSDDPQGGVSEPPAALAGDYP